MIVHPLTLGVFSVNNYLIHSQNSSRAILIDACEDVAAILAEIERLQLELVYLVNTHGHVDHIAGNEEILKATGAELLAPEIDLPYLKDANLNLSTWLGREIISPDPDRILTDGDYIELDQIKLRVVHTPGHTPGHISLIGTDAAFVGDVIFREGIGRTDFPGGSYQQLVNSIRDTIYHLPDDMLLYNGHGPLTTVAHEKVHNPFVRF